MRTYFLLLVPVCVAVFARPARAEESPASIQAATPNRPAAPVGARIRLDTPAPSRAVPRTYHMHDGFYLRTSLGFGDYRANFSDGNHPNEDFSEHGGSLSLDLLIGGSPSPGLSIGGALLLEPLFGASYDRGSSASHGGFASLIGPFIDGFPDPTRGWHVGGMLGLAGQSFQDVNASSDKSTSAGGIGGAAWFGYDFWIGPEWSIGPQLRLMAMRTSNTKDGADISAWARSFTVGVSVLFN
ncbi:MAG TPA: hypothetical protein VGM44_25260 [Polyangiaceae bacterium]|jgi:hypothetical protein